MQVVQSVEVWNRTDCCGERLTNFNVMLLDSNQTVVASTNVSGQAGTPTTVQVSGTARYVKIQLLVTDYLSLAEVKVWGTVSAPSGSYGALQRLNVSAGRVLAVDEVQTDGTKVTSYLMADRQVSTRVLMNAAGAVTSRHDYLPFGEELGAGTGAPGRCYFDNQSPRVAFAKDVRYGVFGEYVRVHVYNKSWTRILSGYNKFFSDRYR
jgi:hypothetical protein